MKSASLIPAVYVLVQNELGHGLFLRRANTGYADGQLTVPAGHAEFAEGLVTAAARELQEETGLVCTETELDFFHCMRRPISLDRAYVDFYFVVRKWHGTPSLCEPNKSSELCWLDLSNLSSDVIAHVAAALNYRQTKQVFSEWPSVIEG